jgi:HKD family nuclease
MVKPNFLHGKLYHIKQESGIEKAIAGSSNITVNGLGLGGSKNIELNLIIDSDRERQELKGWFDTLWNDQTGLVEDVKEQVLR